MGLFPPTIAFLDIWIKWQLNVLDYSGSLEGTVGATAASRSETLPPDAPAASQSRDRKDGLPEVPGGRETDAFVESRLCL